MDKSVEQLLNEGAESFGVRLDSSAVTALYEFKRILLEWNKKMNLTAIEEERDFIIKHYLDSFSIVPFLEEASNFIDVGTGAGFPGVPVKITRPSLSVVLLDSLEKRIKFLRTAIDQLKLTNIAAVHSRAEDAGRAPDYREKFDAVAARAVAAMPVLLEYCLPLVKPGGVFIAMKGSDIEEEINGSAKAVDILGGEIEEIKEFILPGSDIKRNIIVVRKLRQTPTNYPRKAGKPIKDPLI